MKKILLIFGTRPEAIKLIPIIREFQKQNVEYDILNTNQHIEILEEVLSAENVRANYKLSICGKYTNIIDTKSAMLIQMREVLRDKEYSSIIVQGDTLSALVGAEYGFLRRIPIYHVEAGMRTYNLNSPYPEESFRRMISTMAAVHFCPSEEERKNLVNEGFLKEKIYTVGNTFVDYRKNTKLNVVVKKQILITLHRRENIKYLDAMLKQIADLAKENNTYTWFFPIHPNPILIDLAEKHLGDISNVVLSKPLLSEDFYQELLASELVISDSGGVQEECILNSKKILIIRQVSERKSDFDFTELVPPNEDIKERFYSLLNRKVIGGCNDYYGIGDSAEKIVQIILKEGVK